CAGDTNDDGVLTADDIQDFVRILASPDSDGDGIPDVFEGNDGVFSSPTVVGTDPLDFDTDDDAIGDGDEGYGTVGGLDLHAMGCLQVRKNLLIEVDWFDDTEVFAHSHRPTTQVINAIRSAFSNAPVANPYGALGGVTLIVDYGQGGAFTGGNLITGGDTLVI